MREMTGDDFYELWANQVGRGFGSVEELEAYTKHQYTFYEFGFWALVEKETGDLIGVAGLKVPEEDGKEEQELVKLELFNGRENAGDGEVVLELGYHIFPAYRRRGYGLESCAGILEYGRRELEAGRVLVVEHPPVYTLGKSGHAENLLVGREALEAMGAQFFHIDRGGDITFHGPGQLVCYPILDLERLGIGLRAYIDALEESVIRTVAEYGIRAERIAGASGVWVGAGIAQEGDHRTADGGGKCTPAGAPRKICAIGVRSSRYITMHGFALNVTTDLEWFSRINPCGFTDRGATSIERETGAKVPMDDVKRLVVKFLSEILNVRIYK